MNIKSNNEKISFTDLILNAKFVDGGRGNNYEYDCWGLCLEIFHRFNMFIPDYSIIINDLSNPSVIGAEDKESISKAINNYKNRLFIKLVSPCVPCIIVLKYCLGNFYNHVGTYIGENRFIHITSDRGCVIEHMNLCIWKSRIEGFYYPRDYWSENK